MLPSAKFMFPTGDLTTNIIVKINLNVNVQFQLNNFTDGIIHRLLYTLKLSNGVFGDSALKLVPLATVRTISNGL